MNQICRKFWVEVMVLIQNTNTRTIWNIILVAVEVAKCSNGCYSLDNIFN